MRGGVQASTLNQPYGIWSDGTALLDDTKVYVADFSNNRVLVWTTFPLSNGKAADSVLGQANLTTSTAGAIASTSISGPKDVYANSGKLFVADANNNRVLVWNSLPTTNQTPADVVIGQTAMNLNTAAMGSSGLMSLESAYSDGTKLFIPNNNRILIYNSIPSSNVAADLLLGQVSIGGAADFNNGIMNNPAFVATTAQNMGNPKQVHSDGQRLLAVDPVNNRVLMWNQIPTSDNQPADVVLGQSNKTNSSGAFGQNRLATPWGVFSTGNKVIVADEGNHRVLIWNSIPTIDGQNADLVLGQGTLGSPNYGSSSINNGGTVSAQSLRQPDGVYSDGTHLFVADKSNHRVLIWNSLPTVSNTPADLVLGQPDMSSASVNNGGISATSMNTPISVWSDGTKVVVSDYMNNRILIWTSFPTLNGQAANLVLGQATMSTNTANLGGSVTAQTLSFPGGVHCNGTKLYVSDTFNYRILVWNAFPTSNQQAASLLLGQPQPNVHSSSLPNNGDDTSVGGLNMLQASLWSDGTTLFVADGRNNRIVTYRP